MAVHRGAREAPPERTCPRLSVTQIAPSAEQCDDARCGAMPTGIGSYIDMGDQPSTSATCDMMTAARVGEHMKCIVAGWERLVPRRSRGVIRNLGVRY